jgi:hypothetical protein
MVDAENGSGTRNEATGDILSLPKKTPRPATKLFPGPESVSWPGLPAAMAGSAELPSVTSATGSGPDPEDGWRDRGQERTVPDPKGQANPIDIPHAH